MTNRFRPTVNLWTMTDDELADLLPGQWVSAGEPDAQRNNCGRWYGITSAGSKVVAWNGNARRSGDWKAYQRTVLVYATSRREA